MTTAATPATPSDDISKSVTVKADLAPPVAEKPKTLPPTVDFSSTEVVWNIYGLGFGDVPGKVTLNDQDLETFRWSDRRIKGIMPKDAKPGIVTVTTSSGAKFVSKLK